MQKWPEASTQLLLLLFFKKEVIVLLLVSLLRRSFQEPHQQLIRTISLAVASVLNPVSQENVPCISFLGLLQQRATNWVA